MRIIVFTGPGASGKTSLTSAFSRWLRREFNFRVSIVNLDPAVEKLPYTPDFDVRCLINFKKLLSEEGLGPNGAMIRAADMVADNVEELLSNLRRLDSDYVLVDTPGLSELFLLRDSGPKVIRVLRKVAPTIVIYLNDVTTRESPAEAIVTYLMGLVVRLRLDAPVIPVLSKSDLLKQQLRKTFSEEVGSIAERLIQSNGLLSELASELVKILNMYAIPTRIIIVSAVTEEGFDSLYSVIHEVFCACGDLT
ncbi:MAG: ATP/GTP-binding protein [Desulfurococcaceae archaeon TW002]